MIKKYYYYVFSHGEGKIDYDVCESYSGEFKVSDAIRKRWDDYGEDIRVLNWKEISSDEYKDLSILIGK